MKKLLIYLLIAATTPAFATLFWQDGFDYADGELTVNDGTGDNVSGGLWTPHSGATFNENLTVSSGMLLVNASGSEDANRLTGTPAMGAGEKYYFGARIAVTDTRVDPNTELINNDYFMHLKDDSVGFRARVYLDDPDFPDPNKFTFGLASTSGGQTVKWGANLDFGTEYIVIGSYDYDTGASQLWVNPINEASTFILESSIVASNTAINALAFRQDFLSTGPNNQVAVNVAAIGTDFNAVLNAVPEPSTLGLLGLGALGVLALRRR